MIFLIILTMLTGCVSVKTEVLSETPLPTAAPTPEPTKTALDFKYEVIDFVWDKFWDQKFDSRSIVITGTETLDELEEMIYESFEGFEHDLPMMQEEFDFKPI